MTKIDQLDPALLGQTGQTQKAAQRPESKAFQKALGEAIDKADAPRKPSGPAEAFDPLNHLAGIKPPLTANPDLSPVHTEGLMRAERTLDSLERFEQALGDQRRTLKEVAPLVEDMEGELSELTKVLEGMDENDELYPMLNDVAATAMVQSLRFNRGDYV